MITLAITGIVGYCNNITSFKKLHPTSRKITAFFVTVESVIALSAIIIGHQIRFGSLPSPLQFLKGRMHLSTAMLAVGSSDILLPFYAAVFSTCKTKK